MCARHTRRPRRDAKGLPAKGYTRSLPNAGAAASPGVDSARGSGLAGSGERRETEGDERSRDQSVPLLGGVRVVGSQEVARRLEPAGAVECP
jgi:hypothetical protein